MNAISRVRVILISLILVAGSGFYSPVSAEPDIKRMVRLCIDNFPYNPMPTGRSYCATGCVKMQISYRFDDGKILKKTRQFNEVDGKACTWKVHFNRARGLKDIRYEVVEVNGRVYPKPLCVATLTSAASGYTDFITFSDDGLTCKGLDTSVTK